jgi:hypothetical protein
MKINENKFRHNSYKNWIFNKIVVFQRNNKIKYAKNKHFNHLFYRIINSFNQHKMRSFKKRNCYNNKKLM